VTYEVTVGDAPAGRVVASALPAGRGATTVHRDDPAALTTEVHHLLA